MVCPGSDVFHQLVEGGLAHDMRAEVADHAGSCDECREVLRALLDVEPAQIDRYAILKRIGAGAMGVVYEAHDPELDRKVAIKVLRGAGSAARLKREAQMLAKLHHPNVVAVYDAGEHEGRTFVAMALVDGENLRTWLRRERTSDEIVRVIREAGRGLAAAHAAGVIHRDLKPDNIFVSHDGSVLVGDFGLAFVDAEKGAPTGDGPLDLTQTGMVLGTPVYMAPEHAAGEPTAASDQFSLCVTAWEALYGARPFSGKTFGELQQAIERGELVPTERAVPARLRAALERGLRAKPDERWPSLAELDAALAPPRRRWPWLVAAASLVVAATATVMFARHSGPNCSFALGDVQLGSAAASYEHDWIALRTEVCQSPRPNDARLRCLERAHGTLRELAAEAGSNAPDRIQRAIAELPRIAECRDALDNNVPQDVLVRGEMLSAKIAGAVMQSTLAGNSNMDNLRALDAEANKLGFAPAIVQSALGLGDALSRVGQSDEASTVFRRGLSAAEAAHDDHGVANLVAALVPVATRQHKLDEAATLLQLGDASMQRAGFDPQTEYALVSAHVELLSATGDHDAAIAMGRALLAKVRARPGDTSAEQYEIYIMLTNELNAAGKMSEAAEALKQANAVTGAIATEAPDIMKLDVLYNEAWLRGEVDHTLEIAKQMVAVANTMHDHSMEIEAALQLARAYGLARDAAKMIAANQHLLELLGDKGTPDQTSEAYESIGNGYDMLDDLAHAIDPYRKCLAAAVAGGRALDDIRRRCTMSVANVLTKTGHAHEAREMLEPIFHEITSDPTAPPHRRATAELRLAQALWEDGGSAERPRARALAADAEKDFSVVLESRKADPPALTAQIRDRFDETVAWQKSH